MKILILSLAILSTIFVNVNFSHAFEAPKNYTDTITAVDFYPNGAKFSFKVETLDSDGNFKAILPGSFNMDSVRSLNPDEIEGDIRVESFSRERWYPSQLAALKTQADEIEKLISYLNAKRTALEQTLKMLSDIKPDKSTPDELLKYFKDSQTLRLETENELVSIKAKINQEQAKFTAIRDEINLRRPRGDTSYLVITGKTSGGAEFTEFTAFTTAAWWQPRYILDLDTKSGKIDTDLYVRASQRTGLDYKGDITLHTKTPNEEITNPELRPLRVGIKPKEEKIATVGSVSYSRNNRMFESAKAMARPDMVMMSMAEEDAGELEDAMITAFPKAASSIKETLADRTIEAEGELPGDGSERELTVFTNVIRLKGDVLITLIPELRNNAWIIVSMDESNDKLIPATAELRVDSETSGKISIGEYETQRQIPFGYADAITVKKEALVEKTGVSWFSGVFNSGYKLEITNGTKTERVITVKDRLPIPTDEKIKLEVKQIEPKEKERDKENRLTWEITVPAGATVPIIVDYKLSYPSGEELLYR